MKMTAEQKAAYGITHEGEDVPDDIVTAALQRLSDTAKQGQQVIDKARAECRRVATLALLGNEEGTLPPGIASLIDKANADELEEMTKQYAPQAEAKLGRSSVEEPTEVHEAGGIQKPKTTSQAAQPVGKPVPIY